MGACDRERPRARSRGAYRRAVSYILSGGGTDNHLMLVDLRSKNLTGKVAEQALNAAGITVNKNTVPKETQSPFVTSGIRLGTPAVTTRDMGVAEVERIAGLIETVLADPENRAPYVPASTLREVRAIAAEFPLYPRAG